MSPLLAHKADITRLSSKRPKISKIFCEASPHSARATVFGGWGTQTRPREILWHCALTHAAHSGPLGKALAYMLRLDCISMRNDC